MVRDSLRSPNGQPMRLAEGRARRGFTPLAELPGAMITSLLSGDRSGFASDLAAPKLNAADEVNCSFGPRAPMKITMVGHDR